MESRPRPGASLSFAAALGLVAFGFASPLAGSLMQGFGVRCVAAVAVALAAAFMALTSLVWERWQLHLVFGIGSGVATGLVGGVLGAVVANRWSVRHRGVVVGVMGAAVSAGQLVVDPLLTAWGVGLGWRTASLCWPASARRWCCP